MSRRRPVRHRKTTPIRSMNDLIDTLPDNFSMDMCETVTHRLYKFGYSVLDITDTDLNRFYMPMPASHFVMFTRNVGC